MASNPIESEATSSPAVSSDDVRSDAPELAHLLDLRPSLHIYTKSNPHFQDARTLFNHEITTTPRAIIQPLNEYELASSVSFCAYHGLPMTVRSGGHDVHGRSLIQDGVVIDLRALTGVGVVGDRDPPHVVVGPGVKSGDLLRTLDSHGLMTPVGWCPEVSYVGWAAGGGYGVFAGYYGMGADQILGARVLTSAGAVIDTYDDPELLWALRGAGLGNFGVILELRVKTYPRPRVLAGILGYPYAEVGTVLGNFDRICAEALPRAFSGEVAVDNPGSEPTVLIYYHWVLADDEEEALKHLQKMRRLGTLVRDEVKATTPTKFDDYMAPMYKPRRYLNVHSVAIAGFSTSVMDALVKHPPPPTATIAIHHAHGRATTPNLHAAFAMRKRHLVLCIQGKVFLGADPRAKEAAFVWASDLHHELRARGAALDQGYWSFVAPEFCDALMFFGEDGVRRLKVLKERHNPRDSFPQANPLLDAP